jgi:predicted aconitase with swiveling domain
VERLSARVLVAGEARAPALVTDVSLSWWGGVNPRTGEVIDRRHPLSGEIISGRVLVFPYARGSSSTSSAMLETLRAGTAPAAIVNSEVDPVVVLGAVVADELWGRSIPIVVLDPTAFARIHSGDLVTVLRDGTILLESAEAPTAAPSPLGKKAAPSLSGGALG